MTKIDEIEITMSEAAKATFEKLEAASLPIAAAFEVAAKAALECMDKELAYFKSARLFCEVGNTYSTDWTYPAGSPEYPVSQWYTAPIHVANDTPPLFREVRE